MCLCVFSENIKVASGSGLIHFYSCTVVMEMLARWCCSTIQAHLLRLKQIFVSLGMEWILKDTNNQVTS